MSFCYKTSFFILMISILPSRSFGQECITLKDGDIQLLEFLKETKRTRKESACIVYAIKELWAHEYFDAIEVLTTYLDFENPRKSDINARTISRTYPATEALFAMGNQSLPALLKILSSEKPSQKARDNAIYTVMMIHRTNMPQGVKLIKTAAIHAETSLAKEYLNKAAEAAIEWCIDQQRTRCEAALDDRPQ